MKYNLIFAYKLNRCHSKWYRHRFKNINILINHPSRIIFYGVSNLIYFYMQLNTTKKLFSFQINRIKRSKISSVSSKQYGIAKMRVWNFRGKWDFNKYTFRFFFIWFQIENCVDALIWIQNKFVSLKTI